jgi:hypothetical protein
VSKIAFFQPHCETLQNEYLLLSSSRQLPNMVKNVATEFDKIINDGTALSSQHPARLAPFSFSIRPHIVRPSR